MIFTEQTLRFLWRSFLFWSLLFVFVLAHVGCATVSSSVDSTNKADRIAQSVGFEKSILPTSHFHLLSYDKINKPRTSLKIYIEGDGSAWLSRNNLSDDPTPRNPLVLTLASKDGSDNVAYLSRPCQYGMSEKDSRCNSDYWSSKRFSEEVISSMDQAIDLLKEKAQAKSIHLIGYSGGGAVAVLLAARRNDVVSLRTIAGNLDHESVNHYHGVSNLHGSLNPIDVAYKVSSIPQEHFIGKEDKVIPSFIAHQFLQKMNHPLCAKIVEVPNASHNSGWVDAWPHYVDQPVNCTD